MTQIKKGAVHLKEVKGGCSPGGTPAMVKKKRNKSSFTLGGVAGALSQALDAKFRPRKAKSKYNSSSDDDSDNDFSSSDDSDNEYSSSDDEGDAPRQVRIVRVAASRNTPSHHNTAVGPVDVINTIISPVASSSASLKSSSSSTSSSSKNQHRRNNRPKNQHRPPCSWGMGQKESSSTMMTATATTTTTTAVAPSPTIKAKRRLSMPGLLGSIQSFDKSKMSTAATLEVEEKTATTKKGRGGGGLLSGIANFDKSVLKKSSSSTSRGTSKKSTSKTSGGGNLLGEISQFKASGLRKTPYKNKKNSGRGETKAEQPTNVLQQAIFNRKLRKVTKPTAVDRFENKGVENSPSFLRVKLRKTGRR